MRFLPSIIVLGLLMLFMGLAACLIARGPRMQKVADCTNNIVAVDMTITTDPSYHLVLAVPKNPGTALSFRGEVLISQSTQVLATIPISSEDMLPFKCLEEMDCYILTWSRTNRAEKLAAFITRGQEYNLKIQFEEAPPGTGSIWLRSLGRLCPGFR